MIDKEYLGDSVYVRHDGYLIWLTTDNGIGGPSNTIALEPHVLQALMRYIERLARKTTPTHSEVVE